jgi:hypothetical protein
MRIQTFVSTFSLNKALFSQEVHRFTSSVGCYTDEGPANPGGSLTWEMVLG